MADNTNLNLGSGGDVIRDLDRAGVKTQVVALDLRNNDGSESIVSGALPVADKTVVEVLSLILIELQVLNFQVNTGLNIGENADDIRSTLS